MCWLLPHPRSTGMLLLSECLAALVVPAGGDQLLLPAQPSPALAIKAALCVPAPALAEKQMFLSSEAGNSSILAFHHVLGQASLLWSRTSPGLHLGSGRADLEMLQPCILLG